MNNLGVLLLTVPETAGVLGIGRSTVYEMIARGDLVVVHIGRSCRVPVSAIAAYVDRLQGGDGVTPHS